MKNGYLCGWNVHLLRSNDYLHQYMKKKGHLTTDDKTGDKYHIN